jgi:hypothetical protein
MRARAVTPANVSVLRRSWSDEYLESYDFWRDRCAGVRLAYGRWIESTRSDRDFTFAAYRAALESEERAARVYQRCAERLHGELAA